jgi:hypothetical protein
MMWPGPGNGFSALEHKIAKFRGIANPEGIVRDYDMSQGAKRS